MLDPLTWYRFGRMFDLHPKTEHQYRAQQAFAGVPFIGDWYGNFMRNRAQNEIQMQNMSKLGLGWSDIKNPWGADLTRPNVVGSALSVSKNIGDLYDSVPKTKKPEKPFRPKMGRYGHRRKW